MQAMTAQAQARDWQVTSEKIAEAVRRIVSASNPLQVILFGSRARGDFREDSDVDLAVVLDAPEDQVRSILPPTVLRGIRMEVTLIVVSKTKFDLHRPWKNSIYNFIDREGIVLYDRNHPESAREDALRTGIGRRVNIAVPAA